MASINFPCKKCLNDCPEALTAFAVTYVISGFMSVVQDSLTKNSNNYLKIKTVNGIVSFALRKVLYMVN